MSEREGFLKALQDDRFDQAARNAFVDYLLDADEPELAEFHRQWTPEKYRQALAWFETFSQESRVPMRIMVEGAALFLKTGEETSLACIEGIHLVNELGDPWKEEDLMADGVCLRKHFWRHWSILTETPIPEDPGEPFSCGCGPPFFWEDEEVAYGFLDGPENALGEENG